MNVFMKLFGFVSIFVLLTIGLFGLRSACPPRDMLMVSHRGEEVERLHQAILRHQEAQYQAAKEWMTQCCTWKETLQRLKELDAAWPGYTRVIGETMQLPTEERHYQFILHYIQTVLRGRPKELTVVLRRLGKDSQQLQAGSPKPGIASQDARARQGSSVQDLAGASSSLP